MGINILQTIPPNVSIMKRLLFGILATLPLAYCMTGCSNYNRGIQMYRFPNSDVQKSVIFEGIKKRLKIV